MRKGNSGLLFPIIFSLCDYFHFTRICLVYRRKNNWIFFSSLFSHESVELSAEIEIRSISLCNRYTNTTGIWKQACLSFETGCFYCCWNVISFPPIGFMLQRCVFHMMIEKLIDAIYDRVWNSGMNVNSLFLSRYS